LDILYQSKLQEFVIRDFSNDRGNAGKARQLRRSPSALPSDKLE